MDTELKAQLIAGIAEERRLQRKLKKSYYEHNFWEFSKDVVGWKDLYEPLHKPLCDFVTDNVKKKQVLIELPRGTFKSSVITVGYTVWKILHKPDIRILIVNATYPMVVKFIGQVQDQLRKNPKILEIYGDITKDAEIWNESTIKLKTENSFETKEPTLFGYGMTGNLVSTHYDVILLDDLVNWDNVATMDQIEKVKSFYKSTLDLLEPFGELVVIGTPYHYSDLYYWITDPDEEVHRSFVKFIKPAYTGDFGEGELLFPNRLGWDRLAELRRIEGPYHFASQYMLQPQLDSDAIFHYDFKYFDDTHLRGVEVVTFMAIDPAFSDAKGSDSSAIVVVSVDTENNWYIRDLRVGHWAPMELLNQIIAVDQEWKPKTIAIETVAFQKALAIFFKDEIRQRRMNPLPIKFVKPETSRSTGLSEPKRYRIESLEPRYASGQIFHNKLLKYNEELEDQLRRFPKNDHDDIIDALAYIEQIAFPPRVVHERAGGPNEYLY